MDLKHGLHMKMSQQLVMTPRLQMALKILQVSTLELEQFLKQELLQNPLLDRLEDEEAELEKDESEQEGAEEKEGAADEGQGDEAAEPEAEKTESPEEKDESSEEKDESSEDLDWDDYLDDVYSHAYGQNFARDDDDDRFERVPMAVATFEDELKHQLHMECEDDALIGVAEYIIDELDSDGYVTDTLEEIARALKIDVERVVKALAFVQALDPPGIAA
ncbi:hypothetical protein KAT82_02840, partial [bacterium]|nr:hypothetical protein [bacterium]